MCARETRTIFYKHAMIPHLIDSSWRNSDRQGDIIIIIIIIINNNNITIINISGREMILEEDKAI